MDFLSRTQLITAAGAVALALGCGDSGSSVGDCIDMTGAWTISQHCETDLVGMTVNITQNECNISMGAPFTGWTGAVNANGSLISTGQGAGTTMTCTGTVAGNLATLSCTPGDCVVTLQTH